MIDPVTRRLFQNAGQSGPLVLMYHSIQSGAGTADWRWATTQKGFTEHLDLLQDFGWTTHLFNVLVDDTNLPDRSVVITFDDGYADNLLAVEELSKRGLAASFFVVSRDIGRRSCWHDAEFERQPMLSQADMQDMLLAGMEIGAHSRRHTPLPGLPSSELADEVTQSRTDIEQLLGSAITNFSYPYGRYDDAAIDAVKSAGYRAACCTKPGVHRPSEQFAVRRLAIYNDDTPARFARKLAFADNRCGWPFVGRYFARRLSSRLGVASEHPNDVK